MNLLKIVTSNYIITLSWANRVDGSELVIASVMFVNVIDGQ